ncbi:MAG: carboxylate-amine ligase [Gammaproteobacteria bacterium]|nr:carboxylate-amine ligase [Gammaproteobacteria bacterium]
MAKNSDLKITLGVEEEAFLIDPQTRDLISDPAPQIFDECEKKSVPHKVVREMLRTQIETNSKVCHSVAEVREALRETRGLISATAKKYGAEIVAMSTHPFAVWQDQIPSPKERYESFAMLYQEIIRRFLIGGMHIHAGFGDADMRIRVMNVVRHYLPLFLGLSTSSPFREGVETGFKSSRMNILCGLPRTGIPKAFSSYDEFKALEREYQRWGFITNSGEVWWDIRPSHSYPTIELRVCDVCTRIDDAMTIVALYACLIRKYMRTQSAGALVSEEIMTEIIFENRFQAQRYGTFAFFADPNDVSRTDIDDVLNRLLKELYEDAEALDCVSDIEHARDIVKNGTGADRQLDQFRLAKLNGKSPHEALCEVVDTVVEETIEGT